MSPAVDCVRLKALVDSTGLPWGGESSIKLGPGRLLAGRLLVALQCRDLGEEGARRLAHELGIPPAGWARLAAGFPRANAVFFGVEESPEGGVCKAYLEFWDEVRRLVRADPGPAPRLLHLGVKWSARAPDRFELAHYHCHPLLGTRDVLRRMAGVYGESAEATACRHAQAVLRKGVKHTPGATFLYEEVSEEGNPRRSWDVNLYKTGLHVRDAMPELAAIGEHFEVRQEDLVAALAPMQDRLLGHLSGGIDRRGAEFLSVYAELQPLPQREP